MAGVRTQSRDTKWGMAGELVKVQLRLLFIQVAVYWYEGKRVGWQDKTKVRGDEGLMDGLKNTTNLKSLIVNP